MFPFFSVIDDTDDDENETETTTQNNSGNLFRENHPYVATLLKITIYIVIPDYLYQFSRN